MTQWRDIPGYEGLYQCSPSGQIKSNRRVITRCDGQKKTIPEKILSPQMHSRGYAQVTLCREGEKNLALVHRLIATTFIPNPDGLPCVNHKNENKRDNRASNLEWCTVAYNNDYGDRVQRIANKRRGRKYNRKRRGEEVIRNENL